MANEWASFFSKNKSSHQLSYDLHNLEITISDFQLATILQNILIEHATGGTAFSDGDYQILRKYFLKDSSKTLLPDFVKNNFNLKQFWNFIKPKFASYAERRTFIYNEFLRLLRSLEEHGSSPAVNNINEKLFNFDDKTVNHLWQKALERIQEDPENAISLARSLIESVCKNILDKKDIEYEHDNIELSDLYKKTAQSLNLHSSQHEEKIIKGILSSCSSIVQNLGNLRNTLGDSHGKSTTKGRKAAPRHAELTVNLAGSMSLFLIQTFENSEKKSS
jgi:hypothetical protein